ncbi:DUF5677 domain-containing protein [uncultured Microbulbifer sp.]|uniref:DUF5677 domain-containing protein n=1 Tax=uncultured Microbulbifer sp. TaxID=348147 RepID=UPI002609893F|nr:DUF5677 domain-containing protein [uncultured Microbulbifer sp.]
MDYKVYLKQLDAIVDFSEITFNALCIDNSTDARYFVMMGLYASLIERSRAFSRLFHDKLFSSTQLVARSVFEIFIDMKNVDCNGNYVNYLYAEYHDRNKSLARKESQKKIYRKKRSEAYSLFRPGKNYEELTIRNKFTAIDYQSYYDSIYSRMSGNAHSGYDLILSRLEDGGDLNKLNPDSLFKNLPNQLEVSSVPLVSLFLKESTEIISKPYGVEGLKIVDDFFNELDTFIKKCHDKS